VAVTRWLPSALVWLAVTTLLAAAPARAQCPDGTPPPCGGAAATARPAPNSIAVLTFENTARDTAAQYLAEGLADQISTRLGGVARLTMISRSVVRRLRNPQQQSIQQIGRSLNVAYLVNGAIRAASSRVRVNVEAVRAATGEAVWSEAYDRASDDLIGLEEAIAIEVAAGVAGRLSPAERRALSSRTTASSAAYQQFLHGNVLLARRTVASLRGALGAYREATSTDLGFADAYARLAYGYVLCANWGLVYWAYCGDVDSLLALARPVISRALHLSPRSSDAWMARAYAAFVSLPWTGRPEAFDDSLLASLAAFRRSVESNPRNDEAWHQYGAALEYVNDSASLAALHRALELDPARAVSYVELSFTYAHMGQLVLAEDAIDSALTLDPDFPAHYHRAYYRWAVGDTAGALADARLSPDFSVEALAALAHDSAAIRVMDARVAHPRFCGDATTYLLWTGRREQAIRALLQCAPSIRTRFTLRWPNLKPLNDDPRIQALRAQSDSILARARWR
jgi:TolB-like protein